MGSVERFCREGYIKLSCSTVLCGAPFLTFFMFSLGLSAAKSSNQTMFWLVASSDKGRKGVRFFIVRAKCAKAVARPTSPLLDFVTVWNAYSLLRVLRPCSGSIGVSFVQSRRGSAHAGFQVYSPLVPQCTSNQSYVTIGQTTDNLGSRAVALRCITGLSEGLVLKTPQYPPTK